MVVVRHPVGVAAADLDVVAVHAVVADLERADAGALALALFQIEQEAVAVLGQVAQFVEFGIVTAGDDAAVADQHRWGFDQRAGE